MARSKIYHNELGVVPASHLVDITNHNGTTQGLQLGSVLVTLTAAQLNRLAALASTTLTTTGAELNELHSGGAVNADFVKLHAITASAVQIDQAAGVGGVTAVTGAGALASGTNIVNSAAGIALTLPAATGSGKVIKVVVGITVSSSATTITAAGSDKFYGVVLQSKAATAVANYNATGSSSIFTMDGSTKGGLIGDTITLTDVASAKWALQAHIQGTGSITSPLS